MSAARTTLASAVLLSSLLVSGNASAFCRTTTCDPFVSCGEDPEQCCEWNADGCDTNGIPISWWNSCISFAIHDLPSEDRNLSQDDLSDAVDLAFASWLGVDCGGSAPTLSAENYGPSFCGEPTFNQGSRDPNANVWMYRDGTWSHNDTGQGAATIDASTLALTTITFNWRTGEVLDADVELNTAQAAFTKGDKDVDIDLQSIVQHESGHFLGLDHSRVGDATMASGYTPHSVSPRSLHTDDEAAICAAYPTNREIQGDSCQAYGIYGQECEPGGGCSLATPRSRTPGWLLGLVGGLALVLLRRRAEPEPARLRSRRPDSEPS